MLLRARTCLTTRLRLGESVGESMRLSMSARLAVVVSVLWLVAAPLYYVTTEVNRKTDLALALSRLCYEGIRETTVEANVAAQKVCSEVYENHAHVDRPALWRDALYVTLAWLGIGWIFALVFLRVGRWVLAGRAVPDSATV